MDDIRRLKRITTLTAAVVALAVTLAVPAIFFVTAYHHNAAWLEEQAHAAADVLSEHVYSYPDTWDFQVHRLEEIIVKQRSHRQRLYFELKTPDGVTIFDVGDPIKHFPDDTSAPINDGASDVATLIVTASLSTLVIETLIAIAVGLLIAVLVHWLLRILPFATLERVTRQLLESRQQLALEIEAKDHALEDQQRISEQMRYSALHDELTDLPNRKYYYQELSAALEHADENDALIWVMIIDLDRFKEINDALGHELGDAVLVEVARRLRQSLPNDVMVARLGGDEYALLMANMAEPDVKLHLVDLNAALKSHLKIHGYHLAIHASIGVARYPAHGSSRRELLRHADIAMYHAKSSGESWVCYDKNLDTGTLNRLTLIADLRYALDHEQLKLHYQPIIDLTRNEVVGAEALARWHHPQHGFVRPDVFIAIAEQSSMINALTYWAVVTALKQLKTWLPLYPDFFIAVNISARNLQDEQLPDHLAKLLTSFTIPPKQLTLEITETSIMNDPEQSRRVIQRLADLGISIAIDDFGTGYSSLSYLKRLAVEKIKIDRSFVMNLLSDKDDRVIVQSTVDLAHNLGLAVVAEGIENQQTNEILRGYRCDFAQGYHICKPIPPEDFLDWLTERNTAQIHASR